MISSIFVYSQTKDTLENITELKSIKVNGKRRKPVEIINERNTGGLFSNMVTSRI